MMKLHELFERDNVDFPEWLSDDLLKENWEDATYLQGENTHKWELTTIAGYKSITLEDEVYTAQVYDENNQLIFEKVVTPEYQSIT